MVLTPAAAAYSVLDRADGLLELASSVTMSSGAKDDLARMAWVMGVSAIDTYLHQRVSRTELQSISRSLSEMKVPFGDLVDLAEAAVKARQDGKHIRPMVRVRNTLRERILTDTYQSAKGVETAMSLLGATNYWGVIVKKTGDAKVEDSKARLNEIVHRRNRIVHEGDLMRQSRPRLPQLQAITADETGEVLVWIRRFVGGLVATE